MRKTGTEILVSILSLVAMELNASIITNYYENFVGDPSTALTGTMPDITPTGTETWSAAAAYKTSGWCAVGLANNAAYLPSISMAGGNVYSFQVNLGMNSWSASSVYWAAIALRSTTSSGNYNISTATDRLAFIGLRRNGDIFELGGNAYTGSYGMSSPRTLGIVLDLSSEDSADWTLAYTVDGIGVSTNSAASFAEGNYYACLGYQGSASYSANPTWNSLLVTTSQIPEPASISLMVLAAGGLVMMRRIYGRS